MIRTFTIAYRCLRFAQKCRYLRLFQFVVYSSKIGTSFRGFQISHAISIWESILQTSSMIRTSIVAYGCPRQLFRKVDNKSTVHEEPSKLHRIKAHQVLVVGAIMVSRLIRRRRSANDEIAEPRVRRANAFMGGGIGLQWVPMLHIVEDTMQWLRHAVGDDDYDIGHERDICCICLRRRARVVFDPCGHMVTCFICAYGMLDHGMARCPLCLGAISRLMRVFGS